jgi:hypothetical protein
MIKLTAQEAQDFFIENYVLKESESTAVEIKDVGVFLFYSQKYFDNQTQHPKKISTQDANKIFNDFLVSEKNTTQKDK